MKRVTILIPTHNRGDLLGKTIMNCFKQTYKDFKILIYDDGSTDNTSTIIKKLQLSFPNRIQYLKSKSNHGIGYARHELLKNLSTEFGVWLDSDDYMKSDRLAKCINYLDSNPSVDIVFSYLKRFHEVHNGAFTPMGDEIKIDVSTYDKTNYRSLYSNTACATAFFRKSLQKHEVVPLRYGSEDVLWLWKLLNADVKVGQINETLYFYRSHRERLGIQKKKLNKEDKIPEEIIIHQKIEEYRNE